MSDDARRTGRVDFTGTLTIVAIKLTSLAMDYQDGLKALKDDAKRAERRRETRERAAVWSPSVRSPSPIPPFLRVLVQGSLAAAVFLLIFPHLDLSLATDPARFFVLPFLRRLLLVFHATLVTRWRCYIVWSIAEAAMVAGGLGFSGWVAASGAERQVASWDRARNVNILGMELASTGADVAKNWNISFSTWLRIYVYERLEAMPRKSALFNLLFTFFISAISHGLNPGDLIGFAHWALMIAGSRVIYRWSRPLAQGSLPRRAASLLHFLYVLLCINYAGFGFSTARAAVEHRMCVCLHVPSYPFSQHPAPPHPPSPPWFLFPPLAFLCTSFIIYNLLSLSWCSFVQVMTFQHTVQAYRGLYYYGTLVPVMLIVAGNFIRTPRPRGAKKSLKTE
ncbi:unnamed protein product [Closterium sp. NIES-65]|nr:unnamed protein product [Closterium sp. NIES-65]